MQRTLQEEADNALDLADKATAALEEEKVQLAQQNKQLQQQLTALQGKQGLAVQGNRDIGQAVEVQGFLLIRPS